MESKEQYIVKHIGKKIFVDKIKPLFSPIKCFSRIKDGRPQIVVVLDHDINNNEDINKINFDLIPYLKQYNIINRPGDLGRGINDKGEMIAFIINLVTLENQTLLPDVGREYNEMKLYKGLFGNEEEQKEWNKEQEERERKEREELLKESNHDSAIKDDSSLSKAISDLQDIVYGYTVNMMQGFDIGKEDDWEWILGKARTLIDSLSNLVKAIPSYVEKKNNVNRDELLKQQREEELINNKK